MVVSKRPKSFPGAADVEQRGALSKWVPGPRQKAQFMIDLFLLNDFWLKSGKRERCLLQEMHFISSSSIWVLVVAMVSEEKLSWTQPTPCMQLSLIHHAHTSVCVCRMCCLTQALKRITRICSALHCWSTVSALTTKCRIANLSLLTSHRAGLC